eukprot:GHVS01049614.1.p1 GENE.GHVS01049614.1~~GHVS01049614.1.p1  ORF type:complete len:165 (-),score=24.32 GHVS01049614.1:151-645(-)
MSSDSLQKVKLISAEQEEIMVERDVAVMSSLVKTMLEDSNDAVPLPQVRTAVLEKIVDYCRYHNAHPEDTVEIPKPLKSANIADVVCDWDAKFVDIELGMINEIIVAANFMDIKPLLDLTCAKIASLIKGKTPEEIRKQFNITNDFTPEEEAQIREENKWCEEI